MSKNVLEADTTLNLSDYSKLKLAESYKKLYEGSIIENDARRDRKEQERVYNLSFKDLSSNFFTTYTNILNEMTTLAHNKEKNKDFQNYYEILIKGNRLIYIGLGFIILSLIIFFIFSSS